MTSKRVLIVIPAYEPSKIFQGPINSTKKMISFLLKKPELIVEVVTSDFISPGTYYNTTNKSNDQRETEDGALVIRRHRTIFNYNTSAVCPSAIWGLARDCKGLDWICVVGYYEFLSLIGVLWGSLYKKKILWNTAGALIPDQCNSKSSRKKLLMTLIYRLLVKPNLLTFLAKSEQEADAIIAVFPKSRIKVVPNSIPGWLIPDDGMGRKGPAKIMFAGRINRIKRIEFLIKSLNLLRDSSWHCVIAGVVQDQGYKEELESLVHSCDLTERVSIMLHQDHKAMLNLYNATDIFVLPSISENFGMAALEAAACGAFPVLSIGVGFGVGLNELDSRMLKRFSENDELTHILSELTQNIEELRSTAEQRKKYVNTHYGSNVEELMLNDIFQDLNNSDICKEII